jgi:hypothetical protein
VSSHLPHLLAHSDSLSVATCRFVCWKTNACLINCVALDFGHLCQQLEKKSDFSHAMIRVHDSLRAAVSQSHFKAFHRNMERCTLDAPQITCKAFRITFYFNQGDALQATCNCGVIRIISRIHTYIVIHTYTCINMIRTSSQKIAGAHQECLLRVKVQLEGTVVKVTCM